MRAQEIRAKYANMVNAQKKEMQRRATQGAKRLNENALKF
jgi:hypothetical protein